MLMPKSESRIYVLDQKGNPDFYFKGDWEAAEYAADNPDAKFVIITFVPMAQAPWEPEEDANADRWIDRHSVDCLICGELVDERECLPVCSGGDLCKRHHDSQFVIQGVSRNEADPDTGEGLYWSNDDGWVLLDTASRFTAQELADFDLPIGGAWVEVA